MHGITGHVRRGNARTYRQGVRHGVAMTVAGMALMVAAYFVLAYGLDRQHEMDTAKWERNERLAAEWGGR